MKMFHRIDSNVFTEPVHVLISLKLHFICICVCRDPGENDSREIKCNFYLLYDNTAQRNNTKFISQPPGG